MDVIRMSFANGPHNTCIPTTTTPDSHAPANIIGLPLLMRMKMHIEGAPWFENLPV